MLLGQVKYIQYNLNILYELMSLVVFASYGVASILNYCMCCDCYRRTCIQNMFFPKETPVDHHQVPRLFRPSLRGPHKLKPGHASAAELHCV